MIACNCRYSRCRPFVGALSLAVLGMAGVSADAQTIAQADFSSVSRAVRIVQSNTTNITYSVKSATLEQALRELARQAGLSLAVNRTTIRLDRLVSVDVRGATLDAALATVLRGTGLEGRVSPDGSALVIIQSQRRATGTIVGKVVNSKTKQPVSGVRVTIDETSHSAVTGSDGTFRFSVDAGEYLLAARAVGFTRRTQKVVVSGDQTMTVEVVLEPGASVLDEVIVTGTIVATERRAIPTPITVITAADIEKRGITRLEELFRGEVPGVLALERGIQRYDNVAGSMISSSVLARGRSTMDTSSASPLKTYVDGVELVDPSYLGTIDPQSIEKIEIVTGPQAATIYGSGAIGGVMQIFLKKGRGQTAPVTTLNLRYGMLENNFSSSRTPSHSHSIGLTGGTGPAFSYSATGSYQYSGQWQPMLFSRSFGGSVGATHTAGVLMVSAAFAVTAGRNGTVNSQGAGFQDGYGWWSASNLHQRIGIASGDFFDRSGYMNRVISQQISTSASQTASANVDYRLTPIWQHHLTIGRSQVSTGLKPMAPDFNTISDTLFHKNVSNGSSTNASYNTTFMPRFGVATSTVSFGLDGSWSTSHSTSGCGVDDIAPNIIGCWGPYSVPPISYSQNHSYGGFVNWQLGLFNQVFFTTALRGERNPNYGSALGLNWTPRYGVTYALSLGSVSAKFLASYGRATRPPRPEQRLAVVATYAEYQPTNFFLRFESPDLGPEYSYGPQGGVEFYFGNVGSLTVNRYVQHVVDLIQLVDVDSIELFMYNSWYQYWQQNMYLNTSTIRQHGWETTGALNIWALRLQGTYSWNESRIQSVRKPSVNEYFQALQQPGSLVPGQPTHSGNVLLSYAHRGTSITWNLSYIGSSLQRYEQTVRAWNNRMARLQEYLDRRSWNTQNGSLISSPAYTKSNLAVSQRMNTWASATVNITNLGNSFASEASQLSPSLGRQTLIGVSLRYPAR